MDSDILENINNQDLLDLTLYNSIINLLKDVKLVHGPEGLTSTLKRHKKMTLFLRDMQKRFIIDLEGKISGSHCINPD